MSIVLRHQHIRNPQKRRTRGERRRPPGQVVQRTAQGGNWGPSLGGRLPTNTNSRAGGDAKKNSPLPWPMAAGVQAENTPRMKAGGKRGHGEGPFISQFTTAVSPKTPAAVGKRPMEEKSKPAHREDHSPDRTAIGKIDPPTPGPGIFPPHQGNPPKGPNPQTPIGGGNQTERYARTDPLTIKKFLMENPFQQGFRSPKGCAGYSPEMAPS
ncbi:MAG: hypothetical protein CM15mP39_05250 [Synechococcus sp.]|nr:MAG: hypothetical protein CM15mP39_05250 [Synechococcus sp.]